MEGGTYVDDESIKPLVYGPNQASADLIEFQRAEMISLAVEQKQNAYHSENEQNSEAGEYAIAEHTMDQNGTPEDGDVRLAPYLVAVTEPTDMNGTKHRASSCDGPPSIIATLPTENDAYKLDAMQEDATQHHVAFEDAIEADITHNGSSNDAVTDFTADFFVERKPEDEKSIVDGAPDSLQSTSAYCDDETSKWDEGFEESKPVTPVPYRSARRSNNTGVGAGGYIATVMVEPVDAMEKDTWEAIINCVDDEFEDETSCFEHIEDQNILPVDLDTVIYTLKNEYGEKKKLAAWAYSGYHLLHYNGNTFFLVADWICFLNECFNESKINLCAVETEKVECTADAPEESDGLDQRELHMFNPDKGLNGDDTDEDHLSDLNPSYYFDLPGEMSPEFLFEAGNASNMSFSEMDKQETIMNIFESTEKPFPNCSLGNPSKHEIVDVADDLDGMTANIENDFDEFEGIGANVENDIDEFERIAADIENEMDVFEAPQGAQDFFTADKAFSELEVECVDAIDFEADDSYTQSSFVSLTNDITNFKKMEQTDTSSVHKTDEPALNQQVAPLDEFGLASSYTMDCIDKGMDGPADNSTVS